MLYFIALLPPILFILVLLWLDSFSLVKKGVLLSSFGFGIISVPISFFIIKGFAIIAPNAGIIGDPIIEEIIKGTWILVLLKHRRCAFFIDAALYGAAIGAGFSFLENILYIYFNTDIVVGTALVRGLGTAIMHCGCVISTAVIMSWIANKKKSPYAFFPLALIPAMALHILYNLNNAAAQPLLSPMLLLFVTLLTVSIWTIVLFSYNEKSIGNWIEGELSAEVQMLAALKKGTFSNSKAGQYMLSVKEQFKPECYFDMFCYVRLYYELSLASKTNMMRAEAGFPIVKDKETSDKVHEFNALKKQIGTTAQMALSPIVKQSRLNEWKIDSLS